MHSLSLPLPPFLPPPPPPTVSLYLYLSLFLSLSLSISLSLYLSLSLSFSRSPSLTFPLSSWHLQGSEAIFGASLPWLCTAGLGGRPRGISLTQDPMGNLFLDLFRLPRLLCQFPDDHYQPRSTLCESEDRSASNIILRHVKYNMAAAKN